MKIEGKYGGSNLVWKRGIIVDLTQKTFTKFEKLFAVLKFKESAKPLPKVDYILLFRTLYNKCQSCAVDDFDNASTIQLSFVHDKNRKLIVHESKNINDMKKLALQLADALNVKVRDSATDRRHPKWMI